MRAPEEVKRLPPAADLRFTIRRVTRIERPCHIAQTVERQNIGANTRLKLLADDRLLVAVRKPSLPFDESGNKLFAS